MGELSKSSLKRKLVTLLLEEVLYKMNHSDEDSLKENLQVLFKTYLGFEVVIKVLPKPKTREHKYHLVTVSYLVDGEFEQVTY